MNGDKMGAEGSKIVYQCENFTVRSVRTNHGEVEQCAIDAVIEMATKAFAQRPALVPHLFITVIAGTTLNREEDAGFGMYHAGMQHVAIAGVWDESFGIDREWWLSELKVTVAHEIIHYEQELLGTLYSSEENELETERIAYELAGVERVEWPSEAAE